MQNLNNSNKTLAKFSFFVGKTELQNKFVVVEVGWQLDVEFKFNCFAFFRTDCRIDFKGVHSGLEVAVVGQSNFWLPGYVRLVLNHPLQLHESLGHSVDAAVLRLQVNGSFVGIN